METLGTMRNVINTRDLYQTLMRLFKRHVIWPRDLLILKVRKWEKKAGSRCFLSLTSGLR